MIEGQTSRAIELLISWVVHIAHPHDKIELQLSVDVVHFKALEFGIVKPVR